MTSKKNKITKISIIVLLLLLLFFGVNYYSVKVEFADFKKQSELEINVLESQLSVKSTYYFRVPETFKEEIILKIVG